MKQYKTLFKEDKKKLKESIKDFPELTKLFLKDKYNNKPYAIIGSFLDYLGNSDLYKEDPSKRKELNKIVSNILDIYFNLEDLSKK